MKKLITLVLALSMVFALAACGGSNGSGSSSTPAPSGSAGGNDAAPPSEGTSGSYFAGKNLRIVIGSGSTSGDTYLMTSLVARYLADELGANVAVDPVGMNSAFEEMKTAAADGLTIMGFHDGTYLGTLFGDFDESYSLDHYTIGPRYGQNPGTAFVAMDSAPYNNMIELAEYLAANPNETVRVAIEASNVSHLAFATYYAWVQENYGEDVAGRFTVFLSGDTGEKRLAMQEGNVDVIAAVDYTSESPYVREDVEDALREKFIGMMDDIPGVTGGNSEITLPLMYEDGITIGGEPYHFSKDFLFYLPEGTDQAIVAELDAAMAAIAQNPEFIAEMEAMPYAPNVLMSADAAAFIKNKAATMQVIVDEMPTLDDMM